LGCDRPTIRLQYEDPVTNQPVYRCPVSQVDPACYEVVDAWWTARGSGGMAPGPLPVAGGWMDQTVWFHKACAILDDQHSKDREDIEAKRKKS